MVALVGSAVLLNLVNGTTDGALAPVGKSGAAILPNGWSVLAAPIGTGTTQTQLWLMDDAFGTADSIVIASPGFPHIIPLEDFLVQVVCMTGDGSATSHIIDCSGGSLTELASYSDTTAPRGDGGSYGNYGLYLREIGCTVLACRSGVHLYRRGRPRVMFTDADVVGPSMGLVPHPTDPTKFAAAYIPSGPGDYEWFEFTVDTVTDSLSKGTTGIALSAASGYVVGMSSPYAASPYAVAWDTDHYVTAGWSGGGPADIVNETMSLAVPEADGVTVLMHEVYASDGSSMTDGYYRLRVSEVDAAGIRGEVVQPYGVTAPTNPEYTSSMTGGSIAFARKAGELVVGMVLANGYGTDPLYSFVAFKFDVGVKDQITVDDSTLGRFPVGAGRHQTGILKLWDGTQWLREPVAADGHDVALRPLRVWDDGLGAWRLVTMMTDGSAAPSI